MTARAKRGEGTTTPAGKVAMTTYLPEEQYELFKLAARMSDKALAVLLEDLVAAYVEKNRRTLERVRAEFGAEQLKI